MSFSVVIPLFNKAPHIERAINSILNQTLQDFEIIVVNDGSTDHGQEIVENIHDQRIRVINQSNKGVSVARNRGAQEAKFDLVAYLDADDEWLPEFLRNIQMLINNFPDCGAYAAAVKTIRPSGAEFYPEIGCLPPEPWIGIIPNIFRLISDAPSAIHSSSIVIPKITLEAVSGFPEGVSLMEDITCWLKIGLRYPIAYNTKRLAIYHQEAVNRSSNQKLLNEIPFADEILNAISYGLVAKSMEIEALDFINKYRIIAATNNVLDGSPNLARHLLNSCKATRKYKKSWYWWRFWASLPYGWPKKLLSLKYYFKGE